jgi:hypothetical protein
MRRQVDMIGLAQRRCLEEARDAAAAIRRRGGGDGSTASGLHSEAVKLMGDLAAVVPLPLFLSTLKSLLRLVPSTPPGPLEKVLVRATCAFVDGWHFESLQSNLCQAAAAADVGEFEFVAGDATLARLLSSTISSRGRMGRGMKEEILSFAGAAREESSDEEGQGEEELEEGDCAPPTGNSAQAVCKSHCALVPAPPLPQAAVDAASTPSPVR